MSIDSKREKFKSSFKAKKYNNAFKLLTSLNYVEIEELLDSLIGGTKFSANKLLIGYYAQRGKVYVSVTFNEYFLKKYYKEFILQTKQAKAFFFKEHYDVLKELNSIYNNPDYSHTFREFTFLYNFWESLENERKKFDSILKKLSFEKLLIKLTIILEVWRHETNQQDKLYGDVHDIATVFSLILNRKIDIEPKLQPINALEFDKLYLEIINELSQQQHEFDLLFNDLFQIYRIHDSFLFLTEKYCNYDYSISFEEDLIGHLASNNLNDLLTWKLNGEKYKHRVNFYENAVWLNFEKELTKVIDSDLSDYNKEGIIKNFISVNYYAESSLPEEIEFNGDKFKPFHYFQVLNSLSVFSNINWNILLNEQLLNSPDENPIIRVIKIINNNLDNNRIYKQDNQTRGSMPSPLHCRNFNDFIEITSSINKINQNDEVKTIFEFASNNLNLKKKEPIDLLNKPFIKFGKNVFWFSELLSGNAHGLNLVSRVFKHLQVNNRTQLNEYTNNVELKIWRFFKEAKFEVKHSYKYNGTEIDVLAFKDNIVFPIQIKSTYGRSNVHEIYIHNRDAFSKAKKQIHSDLDHLQSKIGKARIKELFNIPKTDEYEIFPLIVTNTFEEEGKIYNINGYDVYKISDFELMIILRNWKYLIFNLAEVTLNEVFGDEIPPQYLQVFTALQKNDKILQNFTKMEEEVIDKNLPDWNLWKEGETECSASTLKEAIVKEKLWSHLSREDFIIKNEVVSIGDYKLIAKR